MDFFLTSSADIELRQFLSTQRRELSKLTSGKNQKLSNIKKEEIIREAVIRKYTLRDLYSGMTNESKNLYIRLIDEGNPLAKNFDEYYKRYKDSSLFQIRNAFLRTQQAGYEKVLKEVEPVKSHYNGAPTRLQRQICRLEEKLNYFDEMRWITLNQEMKRYLSIYEKCI